MNALPMDFMQFSQDMNAYTMVFDNLMRKVQDEIKTKSAIKDLCGSMDLFNDLACTVNSQLEAVTKKHDEEIFFPVEFSIDIRTVHNHLDEGFLKIIGTLENNKPSLYQKLAYTSLLKKTKKVQVSLNQLFSTVESMSSFDEWDQQMHENINDGLLDELLSDVETEYTSGNINFH